VAVTLEFCPGRLDRAGNGLRRQEAGLDSLHHAGLRCGSSQRHGVAAGAAPPAGAAEPICADHRVARPARAAVQQPGEEVALGTAGGEAVAATGSGRCRLAIHLGKPGLYACPGIGIDDP